MSKGLELTTIWCLGHTLRGFIIEETFYSWDGKVGLNYKTDQTTFTPSEEINQLIRNHNLTTKQQQ